LRELKKTPEYKAKQKVYRANLRSNVITAYSKRISNSDVPCCACCGEKSDIAFLTIDHIYGRKTLGNEEKNLKGQKLYSWLAKHHYPSGYQTLCWNCNSAKGHLGECPHVTHRLNPFIE